jgi:hypothetical protein
MADYAEQLAALHAAMIKDLPEAMLPLVKASTNKEFSPDMRVAVYRDAYEMRLTQAISSDYPALAHFIGAAALAEAVGYYIHAQPSRLWDLNLYPIGFAAWYAAHSGNASAIALAQLEAAITESFWAEDSAPLDASVLAGEGEDALASRVFTPRASLRLLALPCAANAYVNAFREDVPLDMIDATSEYIAVLRHPHHVQRVVLDAPEYALLQLLVSGVPFGAAIDRLAASPDCDVATLATALPNYLQRWLKHGFFAA